MVKYLYFPRAITLWAVAFLLLNTTIIVLIAAFYSSGAFVSPFDAIFATLVGTLFLNILMTFSGFSSLSEETNRPAAGFSVLFSSVALMIVCIIIYFIFKTEKETPEDQRPRVDQNQTVIVSTIT